MARYDTASREAREQAVKDGRFEYASPHSVKLKCTVCTDQSTSAFGYRGGAWMDPHLGDHAACPTCGKIRPVAMMKAHLGCRWHKPRVAA